MVSDQDEGLTWELAMHTMPYINERGRGADFFKQMAGPYKHLLEHEESAIREAVRH